MNGQVSRKVSRRSLLERSSNSCLSGLWLCSGIRRSNLAPISEARFVVLTTYEGDEDIHQELDAGAQGYLIKGVPYESLTGALERVYAGGRFLQLPVKRALDSRTPNSDLSYENARS